MDTYTCGEVQEFVRQEDVKFIRLAFCGVDGRQRNVAIMPQQLPRAFAEGIPVNAAAAGGEPAGGDILLRPDASTLAVLPWRPAHGRVVRMFCTLHAPDGTPYVADGRRLLREAAAAAQGLGCGVGAVFSFYLFALDEQGRPTRRPLDEAGYLDVAPADRCENVRRELCLYMEEMGYAPTASYHGAGPGQNHVEFAPCDALRWADLAVSFHAAAAVVARQNGLAADFSPLPLAGGPANGLLVQLCAQAGPAAPQREQALLAGVLAHLPAMMAFLAPCTASYARLAALGLPLQAAWCAGGRTQLVQTGGARGGVRLLAADMTADPYLLAALLLRAGLDGLLRGLQPPAPDAGGPALPAGLPQALEAAGADAWLGSWLPPALLAARRGA